MRSGSPQVDEFYEQQLVQLQEEKKQVSAALLEMYEKTYMKLSKLRQQEQQFSFQAGQLLQALQHQEKLAGTYSGTVKSTRMMRRKLLADIKNPKWEVAHHYHMTCIEHAMGHEQPHVMDVGEMIPGHLRIFACAKRGVLYQQGLMYALTRTKKEKKDVSMQMDEVYRQLTGSRAEIKQLEKLYEAIKQERHVFNSGDAGSDDLRSPQSGGRRGIRGSSRSSGPTSRRVGSSSRFARGGGRGVVGMGMGSSGGGMGSIRNRYLQTLQIAPAQLVLPKTTGHDVLISEKARIGKITASLENEWTTLHSLLKEVKENQQEESELLRKSRMNMHLQALPGPRFPIGSPLQSDVDSEVEDESKDRETTGTPSAGR
jgi:hypothetical protein